eukprot:977139_1
MEMDRKYYQIYMQNRQRDIKENDTKYRRITRFNGTIVLMSEADDTGTINFDLEEAEGEPGEDQKESLYADIHVSFRPKDCKNDTFSKYDQVEFQLINENGICMAVHLTNVEHSRQSRRIGLIAQIDKPKKCGFITSLTENDDDDDDAKQENDRKKWPFSFANCRGFDCNRAKVGTRIEFETKYFHKQSEYHAVQICLDLLPYQWFTRSSKSVSWQSHGMDKSRQFEAIYNTKKNGTQIDVPGHMRTTRFQRKVVHLGDNGGLVKDLAIWFKFRECDFDAKRYLRKGDEISYELKKQTHPTRGPLWKVVRVRFANMISFYWQCAHRGSNDYCAVPFRQNFSLEKRYNPSNNQVFTDKHSGKRYKRSTTFKGKLIQSRNDKMAISYG